MKTFNLILLLLLVSFPVFAQDATWTPSVPFQQDTLTETADTLDFVLTNFRGSDFYSVVAYTTTGTDSAQIFTLSANSAVWIQQGVIDLSANTTATQIIATTTPKEWVLLDPDPKKIRLTTEDASASMVIILAGKKGAKP